MRLAISARFGAAVVLLLCAAVAKPNNAGAVMSINPDPVPPIASSGKAAPTPATVKKKKKKVHRVKKKQESRQQQEFRMGFRIAYDLVYKTGDYADGIVKLRALGHDEHADVATLIGFASRKLGRYDDAKIWYEKALAADPKHARTWSYYGMWHAEQGNMLKAQDHLEKVRAICGTGCREYTELKGVMDGTLTY